MGSELTRSRCGHYTASHLTDGTSHLQRQVSPLTCATDHMARVGTYDFSRDAAEPTPATTHSLHWVKLADWKFSGKRKRNLGEIAGESLQHVCLQAFKIQDVCEGHTVAAHWQIYQCYTKDGNDISWYYIKQNAEDTLCSISPEDVRLSVDIGLNKQEDSGSRCRE